MSESEFGLAEAVSMALGGMIGGGIYAVLGVVASVTGPATWLAFVVAGVAAACCAYSFTVLNGVDDAHQGGSVSFVQRFVGNSTLAGITGWTLLVGYVGSMAMYAFAFGEFTVAMDAVPDSVASVPLRPLVSVAAVAGFVGLNLVGARATGLVENVLVAAKVAVLVAFGVGGIVYATSSGSVTLSLGFDRLSVSGPIIGAAVSFVAFQGWQLLFYDQERIDDPSETVGRAVAIAIPAAVLVYVLVAVATVTLAPQAVTEHPHTALAQAAANVLSPVGLATVGYVGITLSALVSTGSAINATLFSAGYFARGLIQNDLLPDRVGDSSASGAPSRMLVLLGVVTAAFAAYGSLGAITSFASLSFIAVFGGMSYLAFRERDRDAINPVPPAVGVVGSAAFFPLLLYHLYRAEPGTLSAVVAIAVAVVAVELLYFERDVIESEITTIEQRLRDGEQALGD